MLKKLLMYADQRCINLESHDRSTALLLLCRNCSASDLEEEILASLLDAGANPNLPENDPFSLPLLCALERRWWRGAELMLDAGADATAMDSEHFDLPATYFARDNVEMLRNLLSRGCDCPDLNHWITNRNLTDAQLKTILQPYILSHSEILGLEDVLLGAVSVSYHESALYILEHYAFDTMYQLQHIIEYIFRLNNGINWADKKNYVTAMTKNIFMSELDKKELMIIKLFLKCAKSCPKNEDGEECGGLCDVNVEQIWINLEHIIRLAEHNGLQIENWSLSEELFEMTLRNTTLPIIQCETEIIRAGAESRRLVFSILHRYAPRWKLRTPTPSGSPCDDEMRPLKYLYRPENIVARLNLMAPLRSLKELCRLSIRASLGHCRIEEKTEGLRDVLPALLREYLYFCHDFLILPKIPQLPEEDEEEK
ncbi:uncharacterized protein LOC108672373 isoform X3 [Hyalella azteca]|uniref:Uncharacterized protein LOC108672373 isoform X3 n=1 Tax=Hyalella azteca TaxID=294128 RepID=A0A979FLU4_HYAAZ|nr:uncharacterized protein LOC108672373 isoform X3 [Hyalella azteca]